MKKVLFEVFGIEFFSYGLLIAIGIVVASIILMKTAKKKNYNEDHIFNLIIIAVISGVIGGKLLYYIVEIKSIIKDPSLLLDFGNGFVIYGAIIGGAIGAIIYSKIKKWNVLEILDLIIPNVALAQGFGRIGCFFAGCCYGAETNLSIGVVFPEDSLAPSGIHIHPTQIYSSIFDFILAFILFAYAKKKKKNGKVVGLYLIIYSIGRFLVEFLRNDPRGGIGVLSTSQFISIFILIFGLVLFNIKNFKGRGSQVEEN